MQIQANDIPLVAKIFCPNAEIVYVLGNEGSLVLYEKIQDKLDCEINFFSDVAVIKKAMIVAQDNEIALINLLEKSDLSAFIHPLSTLVIIDFCQTKFNSSTPVFKFDFINNRDDTIRWIYDSTHRRPIFLNLYNASGWKGRLFKSIFKIGFGLRLKNWLKSGSLQVITPQLFLENINQQLKHGQYAIFTGTVGANRKAVICFEENRKVTQFLKMPLTKKVQHLVDREAFYLTELKKYDFEILVVPRAEKIENSLMVSNVKPCKPLINNALEDIHLLALKEMYQQTTFRFLLRHTEVWKTIQADIAQIEDFEIVNDLSIEKVQNIYKHLAFLLNNFDKIETIPMSVSHGDLTPWNSYLSATKLYVYDWELAERLPILYDAFHYIFQTAILIDRLPYAAIKERIVNLEKEGVVQSILQSFDISFLEAYHFYLLRNTSYYLSRYMKQEDLHMQAHWLIDVWEISLEDACSRVAILD